MITSKQQNIFDSAKYLFAAKGYDGVSMRALARAAEVSLSATYTYYADKNVLLKSIFDETNSLLGHERLLLAPAQNMSEALKQRLYFQFDHIEEVVFVLKYYLHFRDTFAPHEHGYLPAKATAHIEEVLTLGEATGELSKNIDVVREAKVITHTINGFLLEIYPATPGEQEKQSIIDDLHNFIMRSIIARPSDSSYVAATKGVSMS